MLSVEQTWNQEDKPETEMLHAHLPLELYTRIDE